MLACYVLHGLRCLRSPAAVVVRPQVLCLWSSVGVPCWSLRRGARAGGRVVLGPMLPGVLLWAGVCFLHPGTLLHQRCVLLPRGGGGVMQDPQSHRTWWTSPRVLSACCWLIVVPPLWW